jgi:hypothetical protein
MDELVKIVSQKTGLPEAQAKQAAETVVAFLKEKLPPPMAAQLDAVISGSAGGDILGKLGGLLGG